LEANAASEANATPVESAAPVATATIPPSPTATVVLVQGFDGASALVAQQGYTPAEAAGYNPTAPLQVILGNGGDGRRAFFFYNGRYLGTDAAGASANVSLAGYDGKTVTLRYMLYEPGATEPAGDALTRYEWNGSRLVPLDPIPPEDPNAPLSRR
jgi:hypothetical protein